MRTKAKKKLIACHGLHFSQGFLVVTIKTFLCDDRSGGIKYLSLARNLHQRDREIKAPRGSIYDRNGVKIASNKADLFDLCDIFSDDREGKSNKSLI